MAIVAWSDEFKVGDKEIDKEHWGLFALIHDLEGKLADGVAEQSIQVTIDALVAYVDVHFEHEERVMKAEGYPKFEEHKETHRDLERQVDAFQEELKRAPDTFDYAALMEFLSNWLSEHIIKLDMDFAEFRKQK